MGDVLKFTPGAVTKGSTVAFFTDTSLTSPTTALLVSPSGPDLVPSARVKIGGVATSAQVLSDQDASGVDGKVPAVYQAAASPTTLYLAELDYNGVPVSSTKQTLTGADPTGGVPSAIATAPAWADATVYAVGNLVSSGGQLYRCTTAHTSSGSIDLAKFTLAAGTSVASGVAFTPAGPLTSTDVQAALQEVATVTAADTQTGTTYTLVLADAGKVVRCTNASAVTVTVPPNSSVAFPVGSVLNVYSAGVGGVTVAAGAGVTVRNNTSALTQYAEVSLRKDATDEWVRLG